MDVYDSLGVRWGDDVFASIAALKSLAEIGVSGPLVEQIAEFVEQFGEAPASDWADAIRQKFKPIPSAASAEGSTLKPWGTVKTGGTDADKLAIPVAVVKVSAASAEGREQALKTLVARWRREAAFCDSYHATMGAGWKACADQLEAVISASPALQEAGAAPASADRKAEHRKWLDGPHPAGGRSNQE